MHQISRHTTMALCIARVVHATRSSATVSFRNCCLLALLALFGSTGTLAAQDAVLRGMVVDSATSAPISGVTLRILELNRGERTHGDGEFMFGTLPPGNYTIGAWRLGYRQTSVRVEVRAGASLQPVTIRMAAAPASLQAVVVTGTVGERSRDDVLSPTSVLSSEALDRAMAGTLAGTIESQPGVTLTSVGPATEKPVLRGLSGDRVLVLEDGQRPGDLSATSGDHAIAVEALTASRIEVVRGPMSLLYGSSALGGVVNVVRDEIPTSRPQHPHGMVVLQGSSANSGLSGGGSFTSAAGPLAMRAEVSGRRAGDMRTPAGALDNTQVSSTGAAAGASFVFDNGHVGSAYRYYENEYGIPGGFVGSHPEGIDVAMRRHNLRAEGAWRSGSALQDVRAVANVTDYSHEEYTKSGSVGTAFVQRLASGELMTRTSGLGPFESGAFGVRAQGREVRLGGATRTPNTDDLSLAAYAVQEYHAGRWRLQGGVRYDWARFEPIGEHDINVGGQHIPVRTRTFG
ncbi:MAG TPA: TonB-dependent receptor plug domain-containing protein, partial [Gemmatimonadales bacterium]|nr:TonB-dependent receptor plug domain-containing protein [Gemmatimonadales bacterium]